MAENSPDFTTAVVPIPPRELEESDLAGLNHQAIPLLELRIDPTNQEITLHTDADEDRPLSSPVALTIQEVFRTLVDASFPPYPVYWVSGWEHLANSPDDLESSDVERGEFYARLARPAVGIMVSEVDHQVLFMAEERPAEPG